MLATHLMLLLLLQALAPGMAQFKTIANTDGSTRIHARTECNCQDWTARAWHPATSAWSPGTALSVTLPAAFTSRWGWAVRCASVMPGLARTGRRRSTGLVIRRSLNTHSNLSPVSQNSCKCATVASKGRIVGGSEVSPLYKLPYQALIESCTANGDCFLCGGTIVNKRYIVAAAHCLYDDVGSQMTIDGGSLFMVMVGEHNQCEFDDGIDDNGVWSGGIGDYLLASEIHVHPDFNFQHDRPTKDIALLKMAQDLPFSAKVAPACLPTDAAKDYSGQAATVSGWGDTKVDLGDLENPVEQQVQCALKAGIVEVLATNSSKCSDFLGVSASATQLCAWAEGTDACQGDSGGTLTVEEDGKYVLLGVTSFGSGCATADPGVYTRVQGFLPWINNIIADGQCN